jgi:signal transduction histidine kinase
MATSTDGGRRLAFSRRLRVSQLLALVTAVPLTVILVSVFVGILTIAHQSSVRSNLTGRIEPANATALRLVIAMLNQETGIRGYELTGKTAFLQPYHLGVKQEAQYEALLRKYKIPGTSADLADLVRKINVWETETAIPALLLDAKHIDHPQVRIDSSLKGKAEFDAIRGSYTTLGNNLHADVRRTKVQLADSARTTEIAFGAIGAALLISVLLASVLLRRLLTMPIGLLAGGARRVAGGELDHPLTMPGPQDLELLANDIDGMRLRLLSELSASQAMQDQLALSAADLERSNTELEQFAYVASHDLQEPLRKVTSFVQLLQDRYGDQLDERADQYIEFAVDGARRMQQLINDLLAFSRVGRSDRSLSHVSLDELAAAAVADLDSVVTDTDAEISVGPLPTLSVEPALIRTVFQNLIANAIKFRSKQPPKVALDAVREEAHWLFSCADNGIGIEAEYAERIFVIFQRLHTREAYDGTGIGLAMCRKIVEHHGGRMWLDQSYTGGTRMCFTLPADPSAKPIGGSEE